MHSYLCIYYTSIAIISSSDTNTPTHSADSAGNSVMFLSLLSVFSKNWAIAIPTIVSSAICYTNYSPLKCSDATSPLTSLIMWVLDY